MSESQSDLDLVQRNHEVDLARDPFYYYRKVLRAGQITDGLEPFSIRDEDLSSIAQEFASTIRNTPQEKTTYKELPMTKQEILAMSQEALRRSLGYLGNDFIDNDTIESGKYYIGPENVRILPTGITRFNHRKWVDKIFEQGWHEKSEFSTRHPTEEERNKLLSLDIIIDDIATDAEELEKISTLMDFPLDRNEASQLALHVITGHEFGHAVEWYLRTQEVQFDKTSLVIDPDTPLIGTSAKERFARAFENHVLEKFLQEKGLDEHQVSEFIDKRNLTRNPFYQAATDFFHAMQKEGRDAGIIPSGHQLNKAVVEMVDDKDDPIAKTDYLRDFTDVMAYGLPPFTRDQIQAFVAKAATAPKICSPPWD